MITKTIVVKDCRESHGCGCAQTPLREGLRADLSFKSVGKDVLPCEVVTVRTTKAAINPNGVGRTTMETSFQRDGPSAPWWSIFSGKLLSQLERCFSKTPPRVRVDRSRQKAGNAVASVDDGAKKMKHLVIPSLEVKAAVSGKSGIFKADLESFP